MAFFKKIKKNVKATAQEHKDRFVIPGRVFATRFKQVRAQWKSPDLNSFSELLQAWQITEDMIPAVIKSLRIRNLIFIFTLISSPLKSLL